MTISVFRNALVFALFAASGCAVAPVEDAGQSTSAALSATNHPGPNYLVGKQSFDTGHPKVVDGFATKGATALLKNWDTVNFPPGQKWTVSDAGELKSVKNPALCLDVTADHFARGVHVETWTCNGQNNQKWYIEADQANGPQFGVIRPVGHPELCLDATGDSTADGTVLELWTCNGQTNQRWALFSAG